MTYAHRKLDANELLDMQHEEKRVKALRLIYDLKFTFGMDDLARDFLRHYISENADRPLFAESSRVITQRVMHQPTAVPEKSALPG